MSTKTLKPALSESDKQAIKYAARESRRNIWKLCIFPPLIPFVMLAAFFSNFALVKRAKALFVMSVIDLLLVPFLLVALLINWYYPNNYWDDMQKTGYEMQCVNIYKQVESYLPEVKEQKAFLEEEYAFVYDLYQNYDYNDGQSTCNAYNQHLEYLEQEGLVTYVTYNGDGYEFKYYKIYNYQSGVNGLPSMSGEYTYGNGGTYTEIKDNGQVIDEVKNLDYFLIADAFKYYILMSSYDISAHLMRTCENLNASIEDLDKLIYSFEFYLSSEPAYYDGGVLPDWGNLIDEYIVLHKGSEHFSKIREDSGWACMILNWVIFILTPILILCNLAFALRGKELRRKVNAVAAEMDVLGGGAYKERYKQSLVKASRAKAVEQFYAQIQAAHAQYEAALPLLPFATKKAAKDGIRLIFAQSILLDGKFKAKLLKKNLNSLWKARNHAELMRIKQEYAQRMEEYIQNMPKEECEILADGKSVFDGNVIQRFGWKILCRILTILGLVTLGYTKYLAMCLWKNFYVKHTILDGKRLSFDGNVLQLFLQKLKYNALFIITLGIYKFFAPFSLKAWEAKHTHIKGEFKQLGGTFDGSTILWALIRLGCLIANICTLGFLYPFLKCASESWHAKHTVYDGRRLVFEGKGIQLIGKWIQWLLLSFITLGIYSLFAGLNVQKWVTKHTHLQDGYNPTV